LGGVAFARKKTGKLLGRLKPRTSQNGEKEGRDASETSARKRPIQGGGGGGLKFLPLQGKRCDGPRRKIGTTVDGKEHLGHGGWRTRVSN